MRRMDREGVTTVCISLSLSQFEHRRVYIPRNDGEEYAALTYSVFVSLS